MILVLAFAVITFQFAAIMIGQAHRAKQLAFRTNDKKINRSLQCVPTTKIQFALRDQVVKIVGQVRALDRTLEAPLSKRKCVFYEVLVEEYISIGKTGEWRVLMRDVLTTDFLIDDDTDQALIKKNNVDAWQRATSEKDSQWKSGMLNNALPNLESYLQQHGHSSKNLIFNKTLRYSEGVFELGESIVAMGTATWEHAPDALQSRGGYRSAGQRMVLSPLPGGSVLLSDNAALVEGNDSTKTTDT